MKHKSPRIPSLGSISVKYKTMFRLTRLYFEALDNTRHVDQFVQMSHDGRVRIKSGFPV